MTHSSFPPIPHPSFPPIHLHDTTEFILVSHWNSKYEDETKDSATHEDDDFVIISNRHEFEEDAPRLSDDKVNSALAEGKPRCSLTVESTLSPGAPNSIKSVAKKTSKRVRFVPTIVISDSESDGGPAVAHVKQTPVHRRVHSTVKERRHEQLSARLGNNIEQPSSIARTMPGAYKDDDE
ncbi:hypothetical protein BJ165DRAFT_1530818 [Panaeolus papilionaceus]|nr:hypothetical protein BJ165DRAFT_1530818 [Panaeolus papilionaceus]